MSPEAEIHRSRLRRYPGLKPLRVRPASGGRSATPPWTSPKRWPLRPLRRLVQIGFAAGLVLLPMLDVFRIDTPGRYMVIFGQPVLLSEFYFLMLAILVLVFFFSAVTLVMGRVWCGWLCPQTIFYETIGPVGRWMMGQRSRPLRGALLLIAATGLVLVAVATAFFMVSYFVAPIDLLGWLRQGQVPFLAGVALAGLAGAIVADGVLLREKLCIYACPYGLIQSFLTDHDTLRIRFETEHASDCVNCYACSLVCPVHLEPRRRELQLTCIDCGLCVAACQDVLGALGRQGVIDFSFGQPVDRARRRLPVSPKGIFVSAVFTAYSVAFVVAVLTRTPVALSIVPDSSHRLMESGSALQARYLVSVANRRRQPDSFRLEVGGLPGGSATISPAVLVVAPGREQRAVVMLDLPRDRVASGLYRFTVTVKSQADPGLEVGRQATVFVP